MTENQQPDESKRALDLSKVQEYRQLTLDYEALDAQVDALLARYDGATENMPDAEYDHYRELARHRDLVYSQMKALERQLFPDDETL